MIGGMPASGTIDMPIGRHPTQRTRMAVSPVGKPSVTHFSAYSSSFADTLLKVLLETGRTHQIRVHMAHLRHPVFGDQVYGGAGPHLPGGASEELKQVLRAFKRQAPACQAPAARSSGQRPADAFLMCDRAGHAYRDRRTRR